MMAMAIYPTGDKPYMLGLHQCARSRVWSPQEERLLQEIGRRLEDALTLSFMFRNLGESERRLEEAQSISHVGYWERDLATDRYAWSSETYRIFGSSAVKATSSAMKRGVRVTCSAPSRTSPSCATPRKRCAKLKASSRTSPG